MKFSSIDVVRRLLIGKVAEANHPITCLNPTRTFKIADVKYQDHTIYVKGEDTCWFGSDIFELIDEAQDPAIKNIADFPAMAFFYAVFHPLRLRTVFCAENKHHAANKALKQWGREIDIFTKLHVEGAIVHYTQVPQTTFTRLLKAYQDND